ncbi:MAG: YggT family protein [Gammaproteobacteria bacterium]|nr:YggT family protein [Gammaproteobacteria bacterium]
MGGSYIGQAGQFLVQFVFDLYILAVLLRFLLQLVRADFYNPISQLLVKVTNPPLRPLRRIIPGLWGIDIASVVLLIVLTAIELSLIYLFQGVILKPIGLLVLALAELLQKTWWIYIIALFIRVILSWFGQASYNPAFHLLVRLTEPLMAPARRILPPMSGLDLSVMLVFLVMGLLSPLVIRPLTDLGLILAR